MFLHMSVILFMGKSLFRGVSVRGDLCPGVSLSRGSLSRALCPGGLYQWGSLSRGVSVKGTPHMGMCGSMHPTGIHSCSLLFSMETQ